MKEKFIKFYMDTAASVSKLSYCNRKKVGAVIVDESGKNIISFGYNGTPSGMDNCCEENGKTKDTVIHAEANAITKLAQSGNSAKNGYLFVTLSPCYTCAGLIIQSGIKTVYYKERYRCNGIKMLEENGVTVHKV